MDAATILPNELWSQIYGYLDNIALKSLRLTGEKHLGLLASTQLFTTARVAARRGVFEVFKKLTTHPALRNHVREVIYDSSWIEIEPNLRKTLVLENEDLASTFLMYAEQEKIQVNELQQALEGAFKSLPGIRRVVFADLSRCGPFPGEDHYGEGDPPINRLCSGSKTKEIRACCLDVSGPVPCCGGRAVFWRQYGGLILLLRALSSRAEAGLKMPEDISLGDRFHCAQGVYDSESQPSYTYHGGIPHLLFSLNSRGLFGEIASLSRCLRKLDITLCLTTVAPTVRSRDSPRPSISSDISSDEMSSLTEMLTLADGLEVLKLQGEVDNASLNMAATLPPSSKTWKSLQVLVLRGFEAKYSELRAVLCQHRSSLRSIELDDFNLLGGTWRAMSEMILQDLPDVDAVFGFVWQNNRLCNHNCVLRRDEQTTTRGLVADAVANFQGNSPSNPLSKSDEEGGCSCRFCSHQESSSEEDSSTSEELEYTSDDTSSGLGVESNRRIRELRVDEIEDPELRRSVERLQGLFPHLTVQYCKDTLDATKVDDTIDFEEARRLTDPPIQSD
ncbi:hypothetical protein MMC28_002014 [Mycoblastus sanguinarius]|nr:hypothetical protein [Mycoblastus sanguinarius]